MQRRLMLFSHSGLIRQDAIFARAVYRQDGLKSVVVVHGVRDALAAAKQEAFHEVVDVIANFEPRAQRSSYTRAVDHLKRLEHDLPGPPILQDILQDRWLQSKRSLDFTTKYLAHVASRLERLFADFEIVAMVGELTVAAYRLGRRYGRGRSPYLYPLPSRFYPRIYFEDGLFLEWTRCRELFRHFMSSGVPSELIDVAEPILDGILGRDAAPAMFDHLKAGLRLGVGAERISGKLSPQHLRDNVDYWHYDALEYRRNPLVLQTPWQMGPFHKAARWAAERNRASWYRKHTTSAPREKLRFCTFFLHYQPEYTVEGIAFPFSNQIALIRTIAHSLPIDMLLLVKEQPFMMGLRPISYYRELLGIPNVCLVAETENGRTLVRGSRIVFTLTGTAALEAMFFGIPAVVFGRVFHGDFDGITTVHDLYRLADVVRMLLERPRVANRTTSIAVLAAMHSASYPGQLTGTLTDESLVYSRENEERLGSALTCELESRGVIKGKSQV